MNACRRRNIKKRYPKRLEGEILFSIYVKKVLSELKISC